jgi:hypothetical protein
MADKTTSVGIKFTQEGAEELQKQIRSLSSGMDGLSKTMSEMSSVFVGYQKTIVSMLNSIAAVSGKSEQRIHHNIRSSIADFDDYSGSVRRFGDTVRSVRKLLQESTLKGTSKEWNDVIGEFNAFKDRQLAGGSGSIRTPREIMNLNALLRSRSTSSKNASAENLLKSLGYSESGVKNKVVFDMLSKGIGRYSDLQTFGEIGLNGVANSFDRNSFLLSRLLPGSAEAGMVKSQRDSDYEKLKELAFRYEKEHVDLDAIENGEKLKEILDIRDMRQEYRQDYRDFRLERVKRKQYGKEDAAFGKQTDTASFMMGEHSIGEWAARMNPVRNGEGYLQGKYSDTRNAMSANIDAIRSNAEKSRKIGIELAAMKAANPNGYEQDRAYQELLAEQGELGQKNALMSNENKALGKKAGGYAAGGIALAAVGKAMSVVVDAGKQIARSFTQALGFSLSIKDNLMSIANEIGSMLNSKTGMATYDTAGSLFTNSTARSTQMRYGISSSQNYALTQTTGMLGISSEEDLMYMNSSQRQVFSQYMQTYSNWYEQLSSSGVLKQIQQMQLDFTMFKQEIAVDFLKWIAENKDTIMGIMKFMEEAIKTIITIIGNILTFFGGKMDTSSYSASASDSANYGLSMAGTKNVNINMNMSNSATGVLSDQTQLESFFKEQMTKAVAQIGKQID